MRAIILELLKLSGETYDSLILDNYLLWCNLNSHDDIDCQKLLANPALFAWWLTQYRSLERKFVNDALPYRGKAGKAEMRDLYTDFTIDIARYYSKPLLRNARNQQPVTPQHN